VPPREIRTGVIGANGDRRRFRSKGDPFVGIGKGRAGAGFDPGGKFGHKGLLSEVAIIWVSEANMLGCF